MRIKFEKGMTPERIGQAFAQFIRENNLVIGSVNIYVQTFDENMQPEKYDENRTFFICKASEKIKKEYVDDVAKLRRNKLKVVNE